MDTVDRDMRIDELEEMNQELKEGESSLEWEDPDLWDELLQLRKERNAENRQYAKEQKAKDKAAELAYRARFMAVDTVWCATTLCPEGSTFYAISLDEAFEEVRSEFYQTKRPELDTLKWDGGCYVAKLEGLQPAPITVKEENEAIVITTEANIVKHTFNPSILAGQVRQSSIDIYQKAFAAYTLYAGSWAAALDHSTLARWRTVLADTELSPNTINRMLSSVRAVMKSAAEQGYLSKDVAQGFDAVRGVKVSAMKDKLKDHSRTKIQPTDMRRLCDAPKADTLVGKMHHALLLTMASSGARISEVVTLKPTQIEKRTQGKKNGYVIIVSGKTDIGVREAPLSIEAYEAIQAWISARAGVGVASEYIFTGFSGRGGRGLRSEHITTEAAWQTVKRYAEACKLDYIKPHDFRRFVGTNLAKTDARQAQKALGHKDINTTYKHYVLDEMEVGLTDGLF